jgi:hypothetical protein
LTNNEFSNIDFLEKWRAFRAFTSTKLDSLVVRKYLEGVMKIFGLLVIGETIFSFPQSRGMRRDLLLRESFSSMT